MTARTHVAETPATAMLRKHKIAFSEHVYEYVDRGGTSVSSLALGLDEHAVIKTLVMQDDAAKPLIILMHGDCEVSTKALARQIPCKKVEPCKPEVAERHSGYQVGGTSPFGTRKALPIYVQTSILQLECCYINGGKRGYLVGIAPRIIVELLNAKEVECSLPV